VSTIFQKIIDSGFYIATEGYKLIDPKFENELNPKTGMYQPKDEFIDDKFLDINISYQIDYTQLSEFVFGCKVNTDLGQVENTYLAQSTNYDRNYKATSGTVVKETLIHFFEINQIQAAIVIQKTDKALEYKPIKITSIEEVDTLLPSVYHMIDYTDTLKILKEAKEEKIAIVATPWQLDGVYQYIFKKEPELKNKIGFTIGLLTDWYFSYHMLRAMCRYYNLNFDNLEDLIHRGGGRLGKTKFVLKGQDVKIVNRFTFRSLAAFERFFNVPKFLIEVNTQNMLADLVVGDAHTNDCSYSKTGISLILARSKKADQYLNEMENQKKINLLKTDNEHIVRSQHRDRLYGDFAWSYLNYLKEIGEYAPDIKAPSQNSYQPVAKEELEKFHKILKTRRKLQSEGKYWQIFFEKYAFQSLPLYKKLFFQLLNKFKMMFLPNSILES
jgi:coenzyme F420-reducing hydrogenase beta subunit